MAILHPVVIPAGKSPPSISVVRSYQENPTISGGKKEKNCAVVKIAETIYKKLNLLHHHQQPKSDVLQSFVEKKKKKKNNTHPTSPKEEISRKWREIHGANDWKAILNPLHPWLRREIIKYGEFSQATYDAFDFDPFSEYCGSCKYNKKKMLAKLGLEKSGYTVREYIYGMSQMDLPQWMQKSKLAETWSKDSNWIGFMAVSDDVETRRIGRRDIAVAWRGTVAMSEWYDNMKSELHPIGEGEARVEHGFLSIYTSKNESTRYNQSSASEQAIGEIKKLIEFYAERGEEISLTITGHSLGGALALLTAYDAARNFSGIHISVFSFAAPRVGNIAFRDELYAMGVKTLRVTINQDIVPKMPGIVFNENLQKFEDFTGALEWIYTHVGAELKIDVRSSPYLKKRLNLIGFHLLETYLHLIDGFVSEDSDFREDSNRDVALVNKYADMAADDLRIPPAWFQPENKGLVKNAHGRWVKPQRDLEDIPSPKTPNPDIVSGRTF